MSGGRRPRGGPPLPEGVDVDYPLGLTRGLAKELAPAVTVNAICPGIIDTVMSASLVSGHSASTRSESIPLRRFGRPEDIAHAALFLASPWADYVTGEVIGVNGGIYID